MTGHQCWLTKIKSFYNNPISFFYGGMRLSAQETVVETVVFYVNKTFDGLSNLVHKEDNFTLEIC